MNVDDNRAREAIDWLIQEKCLNCDHAHLCDECYLKTAINAVDCLIKDCLAAEQKVKMLEQQQNMLMWDVRKLEQANKRLQSQNFVYSSRIPGGRRR